jgi:copper chaperone CopZ
MEKVTFNVPAMWADHHTLAVRQALTQVDGVAQVLASALYKDVVVEYDPEVVKPETLVETLSDAGYKIAKAPEIPTYPERTEDTSDWFQFQERITETDKRDLELAGEHRKY